MIKKLSGLAAVTLWTCSFTAPALAGSLSDPIVEPPLPSIVDNDWQGLRAGLTYNAEVDGVTRVFSEGFPFINGPNQGLNDFGGFVGYDHQFQNFVLGLELQAVAGENPVQGNPTRLQSDLQSLRARLGYATGKTLFYGSFGLARSQFDDAGSMVDMEGNVYGLGVEYLITDNTFIGLSVDHYTLSGENIFSASSVESEQTVIQLRVGFTF
ncbi:outer membrane beta-barrel protein [Cognatishimia sp. 1_MG-2023]|uniref:outer membrane protein n=1 Tax=Cognatishimia sp. 1_MG-2023 TaxID=3062642 RepID=UPI0026E2F130|nr:porin [Cognatishimia sp. 1_MG-2023]MDO6727438.1 outer membrane beta-barrel protein [Cognatishimia sp. 1_MG-2023]